MTEMIRIIRYLTAPALIAAGVAAVLSCTEVSPIEMQVNGAVKDYAAVRAFKATDHPVSLTWLQSWTADGNAGAYLSNLPDSLDMVVVMDGYADLSEAHKVDLQSVRETKGTRVIIAADLDGYAAAYSEAMLQAEIDGEDKAYEDALAEDPDGSPTDDELEAAIAAEVDKVHTEYSGLMSALSDDLTAVVGEYGYDGILFKINTVPDDFYRGIIESAIGKAEASDGLLLLEGNPDYFASGLDRFDYIISTTVAQDRISSYQDEYDRLCRYGTFSPERYLVYISLEDSEYETPYPDVISSQPLSDPKYKTLALWNPSGGGPAGGMAVRTLDDAGDGYPVLRKTIQYLQLK